MSTEPFSQTATCCGATLEYRPFDLAGVRLVFDPAKLKEGCVRIEAVVVAGETLKYTDRFGMSFATLVKQSPNIFALFDVAEVVSRAIEKKVVAGQAVLVIDRTTPAEPRALAVSELKRKFFTVSHLGEFLAQQGASISGLRYLGDGVFGFECPLPSVECSFEILGRKFIPVITVRLTTDGWGKPAGWLALKVDGDDLVMRPVGDAFKKAVNLGENSEKYVAALARYVRKFGVEVGVKTLRARLDAAHSASASIAELVAFQQAAARSSIAQELRSTIERFSVEEAARFGLSSLGVVGKKQIARVPSRMSVADLLMMATEISSRAVRTEPLQEWLGSTLGEDCGFDLEATLDYPRPTKNCYFVAPPPTGTLAPETDAGASAAAVRAA